MTEPKKEAKVKKPAAPRKKAVPKKKVVVEEEVAVQETAPKKVVVKHDYVYAVGRRKSAVARVRVHKKGDGSFTVNEKPLNEYFTTSKLQALVKQPFVVTGHEFGAVSVRVVGGGVRGQADSVRHGVARALLLINPEHRAGLKHAGLLTRDARVKERKKYGLKRARRAPQWQKR